MTETEILSKLTGIFRDVFDDETLVARPQMTAHEVDRWDLLSHMDMICSSRRPSAFGFEPAKSRI